MAIAEQFAGLQMDQLIAAPLRAAMDASVQLADSTADFISRVGFDNEGKVRKAVFSYQRHSVDEDGVDSLDDMEVSLPLLAIVPIPNLQVDEVNILFDIEVRHSERKSSTLELGASLNGAAGLGIAKASITGTVSAHQANTRSSDNSAKYHVDIRAVNHGTPEGLARVLDLMAANVTPVLRGSTWKDGNGQSLSGQEEMKAEHLRELRLETRHMEKCLAAARDQLCASLTLLKKAAASQLNAYRAVMRSRQDTVASEVMDAVNESWHTFQEQAGDFVKMIADSGMELPEVSGLFRLKAVDAEGRETDYGDSEIYYEAIADAWKSAVYNQRNTDRLESGFLEAKAAYSSAAAGE